MHVHLVFGAESRRGVFPKENLDDLRGVFASVCVDFAAGLARFDGEHDHLHLRVNDPPAVSVSVLGNSVSGRMIRRKNDPGIRSKLWRGAPIAEIRQSSSSRRRPESQSTPRPSALSFPGLRTGVCRAPDLIRGVIVS
jgi:putative transposase